jgi:hypothetical protein
MMGAILLRPQTLVSALTQCVSLCPIPMPRLRKRIITYSLTRMHSPTPGENTSGASSTPDDDISDTVVLCSSTLVVSNDADDGVDVRGGGVGDGDGAADPVGVA